MKQGANQDLGVKFRESTACILHLSDTHRTPDEPVSNDEILLALKADFRAHSTTGIAKPDIVVVSGDLVQAAEDTEYEEAERFFDSLLRHLNLGRDRLVLAPGNHDVHWPTSEDNFRHRVKRPSALDDDYVIPKSDGFLCALGATEYQQRLDNFRAFHKRFFGREYPQKRSEQFAVHQFNDLHLAIACFSSCDLNDHVRRRGRIHPSAINMAADELSGFQGVRVAIWHHDLDWDLDGGTDYLEPDSLRNLSMAAFDIGLCGHTHRPFGSNAFLVMGLPLPVVAAGSLCAGARARSESVPRSYNVIEFQRERVARVHVRWKEKRSTPWCGIGKFPNPSDPLTYVSWFDVPLANHAPVPTTRDFASKRTPGAVRTPHPFRQSNAKSSTRGEVVEQFVWTEVADSIDNDVPQVILGPRGSGKTALLLSLTFDGRVATQEKRSSGDSVLTRIGLMCPMRIGDVTAFVGKETWQSEDELSSAFSAMLTNVLAYDLVSTLDTCVQWCRAQAVAAPSEAEACALLWATWSTENRADLSFARLLSWITQQRTVLLQSVGIRDDHERYAAMARISGQPLMRGGIGPVSDAVTQLARWDAFSRTRWHLLFDEVEFLENWQKRVVYSLLATAAPPLSTKIATLPYAHRFAIEQSDSSLLEGSDFEEVALALTAELEFRSDSEDDTSTGFADVCRGIWRSRLEQSGFDYVSLEQVWPEKDLLEVLREVGPPAPSTMDELTSALIDDLPGRSRQRATALRESDDAAFSDQYWRKYQQPFRFRLANRLASSGRNVPLYWGWRALLRACDGNCRWFLQLVDKCWRKYWSQGGIRALSPVEQDNVVRDWARGVHRRLRTTTSSGKMLQEVVDQVVADFSSRLYNTPALRAEGLAAQVSNLTPAQAEAVGFGIAHGFLVPRLAHGQDPGLLAYPVNEVELRLGFPIAVDRKLPLRTGAVLKIATLRQVVMPWLKDSPP